LTIPSSSLDEMEVITAMGRGTTDEIHIPYRARPDKSSGLNDSQGDLVSSIGLTLAMVLDSKCGGDDDDERCDGRANGFIGLGLWLLCG